MAWLRIDDGFAQHPKIVKLSPRDRWTWLEILSYCARYRTHGFVPDGVKEVVRGATPALLNRCYELHLLDRDEDGFRVHDWDDYNGSDSKVQVRERVRRYRERNAEVTPDVTAAALQARDSRVGARARTRPVPSPTPSPTEKTPVPVAAPEAHQAADAQDAVQVQQQDDTHGKNKRWNTELDLQPLGAGTDDLI